MLWQVNGGGVYDHHCPYFGCNVYWLARDGSAGYETGAVISQTDNGKGWNVMGKNGKTMVYTERDLFEYQMSYAAPRFVQLRFSHASLF